MIVPSSSESFESSALFDKLTTRNPEQVDSQFYSPNDDEEEQRQTVVASAIFTFLSVLAFYQLYVISHLPPTNTTTTWFVLLVSLSLLMSCLWIMRISSEIPNHTYNSQRKTWFGHKMSMEGEWKNIPVVLLATYSFVFAFGAFVSLLDVWMAAFVVMDGRKPSSIATKEISHWLLMPSFYLVGLVLFYAWHVAAHVLKGTELHRQHMVHHRNEYPPHDFFGDDCPSIQERYVSRGFRPLTMLELMNPFGLGTTQTLAHEGPIILGILTILLLAKFVGDVSTLACFAALVGYAFMASFGIAIHMSFHERGFAWEKYAWYRELRALHMIHHMQRKNYAMVNILLDLVFGSLLVAE